MANTPRSRKAKGRRLQQKVCELLLENFPHLEPDDIKSAVGSETGEDVKLSPAARKAIPYAVEAKNQEKLNIWGALQQAESNSNGHVPVLVFKRNNSKTYAVVDIEHFLELIKCRYKVQQDC